MEEITRPEEIEDNFPEPDPATYCKSCQSSWKPNRRDIIKNSVIVGAVAIFAGAVGSFSAPARALTTEDCENQYRQRSSECWAEYNQEGGQDDWIHRPLLLACLAEARAVYIACLGVVAAQALANAAVAAAQWIAEHAGEIAVVVGAIIVIGVVTFILVTCITATSGLCAIPIAAAVAA
jgi:hypothetical protein